MTTYRSLGGILPGALSLLVAFGCAEDNIGALSTPLKEVHPAQSPTEHLGSPSSSLSPTPGVQPTATDSPSDTPSPENTEMASPSPSETPSRGEYPSATLTPSPDHDRDGFTAEEDCDDHNPAIHPGADELCNGLDDDCDGDADRGILGASSHCPAPSCLAIKEAHPESLDGLYFLTLKGIWPVHCDMTTDGGGWTAITLELTGLALDHDVVLRREAERHGIDEQFRPFSYDGQGAHNHHYDINLPFPIQAFYLDGFQIRANGQGTEDSDIYPNTFVQEVWEVAFAKTESNVGDVSFGSPSNPGPTTSFAKEWTSAKSCVDCVFDWPQNRRVYDLGGEQEHHAFRIGYGEYGNQGEGWYPWWGGRIFVR